MPNDYDSIAEGYSAENETSLLNAYYERPAMLDLAGDVAGRRILDAGCGSGPLFAALRDRGAIMTGFDASAKMLELARQRLGDDVPLHLADLSSPLPFPDAAFDDVVASLVLHYLEDWTAPLAELRRVLVPGGRLLVSVNHPFADFLQAEPGTSYFATRSSSDEWTLGGHTAVLTFWSRPLHAMADAFTGAGFRITAISEPAPPHRAPAKCSPRPSWTDPRGSSCPSCSSSCRPTDARSWPRVPWRRCLGRKRRADVPA
ncbi:class I SAM-dependent methyltransferase [Nonomuraea salmonea]|uniref:class I SAM-dependent methyltransferase n=1 Tax=Nonomuraea salmonea TaxID=46181 RepID=UPI002FE915E7